MDLGEILESPMFWFLGVGGVAAELGGWILSKRMGWIPMSWWELTLLIIGTLIIAGGFAARE